MNNPIGVIFVKLCSGVYHFGFKPKSESHSERIYSVCQAFKTVRQSVAVFVPIAETVIVLYAAAEPAVVKNHGVNADFVCLFRYCDYFILIKIKIGRFPVIYKHKSLAIPILSSAKTRAVKLMVNS